MYPSSQFGQFLLRGAGCLAIVVAAAALCFATQHPQTLDSSAPLAGDNVRSEAEQDRLDAFAHFAAGRTYQQRGDYDAALRHFARAARLDVNSRAARSALVECAVDAKRLALAARYAAKGIDPQSVGRENLEVLAGYWIKENDAARAIECLEQALACRNDDADGDERPQGERVAAETALHLELGRLYGLAEKHKQAAEQLARVLDVFDHPERFGLEADARKELLGAEPRLFYEMCGEAFLLSERLDEAEAAFRKADELKPDKTLLDYRLAQIALRRGHANEALAKLQGYLDRRLSSEGTAPYRLLADALKKLGKQNELLGRLKKRHDADPANDALGYFLADAYRSAGQRDLAESLYAELAARSPTLEGYRALTEIYRKNGQAEKLLDLLGQVISKTGSLETLGSEAKALSSDAALLKTLVEAGRKLAAGPTARAEYAEFLALGVVAQEQKQYATARDFFERALQADASKAAEILLAWGIGDLLDERTAEAIEVFRRGAALPTSSGGNSVFSYYLAGALAANDAADGAGPDAETRKAERFAAALVAARAAAQQNTDSARFACRVPWILFRARRYEEARASYEKLLEKFDVNGDSLETALALREVRLELSAVYVDLDRMDEGVERLEEVLDEYPDDTEAQNDLGFLWADRNQHLGRALRMVRAAIAAEPDNRAYRDSLGWVYYRLGRFDEAVVELQKALDEKQPDGTVLDHLGDACAKAGRAAEAATAWRRAAEAYEKDQEPAKARKVREKLVGK